MSVESQGPSVRLAHFSDTHLGYEAYPALSVKGFNQRGADIVTAFINVCRDIIQADPPLVLCSGDVAETPRVANRDLLVVMKLFSELAGLRPDGTRRQLVVVAGNHELPRRRTEPCFLELYSNLPGVRIVTQSYERVRFDSSSGVTRGCDPALEGVVIHALPHDTLKDLASDGGFESVRPESGHTNVLLAHGVAGGSELYVRSLGREFAIPTDVLARGWDYGALGHWHKQGPIPIVATGAAADGTGRIWYAGSTENMGFRDLRDNDAGRGWLDVTVRPGSVPHVERRWLPIRAMFRLPVVQADGLEPQELSELLVSRTRDAERDGKVAGAVVGQIVTGVSRDLWSLVDLTSVRAAASAALHYEISIRYSSATRVETGAGALGDLATVLGERAAALFEEPAREPALALARKLLGRALVDNVGGGTKGGDPTGGEADAGSTELSSATGDAVPGDAVTTAPTPPPARTPDAQPA